MRIFLFLSKCKQKQQKMFHYFKIFIYCKNTKKKKPQKMGKIIHWISKVNLQICLNLFYKYYAYTAILLSALNKMHVHVQQTWN